MTFAEAMALPPEQVEVWAKNTWYPVDKNDHAGEFLLSFLRTARFRRKPAPALTRVQAIVAGHFAGNLRASTKDALECSKDAVLAFGTRLLQLIDGPAVDAFKLALEQAEREFLGPGEGSR